MTWQPLWNDGLIISVHALAAMVAMGAGAVQFAMAKGTKAHLLLGYIWVGMMTLVAGASFWIQKFRWWGAFPIIHVPSLLVLATLVYSVAAIRRGNVVAHRNSMVQLCVLAPLLTGGFTLVPGRTMHAVLFGGQRLWPSVSGAKLFSRGPSATVRLGSPPSKQRQRRSR